MADGGELKAEFRVGSSKVDADMDKVQSVFKRKLAAMREEWRAQMEKMGEMAGFKQGSNIHIAGATSAAGAALKATGGNTGKGLATTPAMMLKDANAQRERAIKLEADLARISDHREKMAQKAMKDRGNFMKDMTFLMMPMMNPGSVWATLFSTRQTFSALSTQTGQGLLKKFGMSGLGGAAAGTGILVGAATAAGVALMGLKKAVEGAMKAYESARLLYAKSLMTGGLGLSFSIQRGMISSVLGVSEEELMKFGVQIGILAPKLKWASDIIAGTNPRLTAVGWQFKILNQDLQAMFAMLAYDGASAMYKFISALDWFIRKMTEAYRELKKPILFAGKTAFDVYSANHPVVAALFKFFGYVEKAIPDVKDAPLPTSNMKQLRASAWEHMGLVIGSGTQNSAQETAKNTKRMAEILQKMHDSIMRNRGHGGQQFGLNPLTSTP